MKVWYQYKAQREPRASMRAGFWVIEVVQGETWRDISEHPQALGLNLTMCALSCFLVGEIVLISLHLSSLPLIIESLRLEGTLKTT